MQLFAKDEKNFIVSAQKAIKNNKYYCLECSSIVKIRRGHLRRPHFFHLQLNRTCKIGGKSLTHLQVQFAIQEMLFPENITLEQRFPSINRIADVCWEAKKLIFEVQCSYITPEEILSRNHDYKKLGYHVVWILHDTRYNQGAPSLAEDVLQDKLHYYTNIDHEKKGFIYDKIDKKKFPINIFSLHQTKNNCHFIPLKKRELNCPYYFKGDVLDTFYESNLTEENIQMLLKKYKSLNHSSRWNNFKNQMQIFYEYFINYLIEHSCK